MSLAVLVTMLASLPLFGGLIHGGTWWIQAAVFMAVVALVSAVYRWYVNDSVAVPFLQLFAVVLLYTPMYAPGTAALGVLPTLETLRRTVDLIEQGLGTIASGSPPVSPTEGLTLIVALLFVVFAMTADFLAVTARCPGMVGGLLLTLLSVPLFVDEAGLPWVPTAICAVGFLALLALDTWVRNREWGALIPSAGGPVSRVSGVVGGTGVVAAVVVLALVPALLLPLTMSSLRTDAFHALVGDRRLGGASDTVTTTHPLVSLRRDLAATSDRTVLTYRTDDEDPEYLRTFVLDGFDGENWTMTPVRTGRDNALDDPLPRPPGREWGPNEEVVTTRITPASGTPSMDFLPLPYPSVSVEVDGDWYVDPATLMVFTTDTPVEGEEEEFVVLSARNRPGAEALSSAGPPGTSLDDHLSLPGGLDGRVGELTASLVEGAGSDYEKALTLQDFFTDGSFTYDLAPPPVPTGSDPLAHFLFDDRTGYCEQYAGAMAVMARQAGIPSRVAVGYTAGSPDGGDRWTVSARDAHAWPELYFEGSGWVRFEPTPAAPEDGQGTASRPDYSSEGDSADEEASPSPSSDPEESASPEATPSSPETDGATAGGSDGTERDDASGTSGSTPPAWLPAVGVALAALVLLCAPLLSRALIRRSRRASVGSGGVSSAHSAWREVRDTCLDLGIAWNLEESPRATARRLGASLPEPSEPARAALWRLALAEETARYAPEPHTVQSSGVDLDTVVTALTATVPPGRRWRALLIPLSLLPRRRSGPGDEPAPAPL
ncbi:transglutaminaseTgpA domain-containing protein [Nocardiopsis alba]|uniref:TransglutaminaseTgpA domain-containing protein n=1 Tax=Nocardiopsis alba TaxID=53437 RepID=A0ABV5DSG5_9ACTN